MHSVFQFRKEVLRPDWRIMTIFSNLKKEGRNKSALSPKPGGAVVCLNPVFQLREDTGPTNGTRYLFLLPFISILLCYNILLGYVL